jgi:hypothetical protein
MLTNFIIEYRYKSNQHLLNKNIYILTFKIKIKMNRKLLKLNRVFLITLFLGVSIAQHGVNSASYAKNTFSPLKPSENYGINENIVYRDDSNNTVYMFFWKLLSDDEILFEVHAKTLGWVGFGISMSGGMRGADIAIGWVDANGKPHLKVNFLTF